MQIDEEDRKLFAGGLNQEVTQDDLKVLFPKYCYAKLFISL